jgi:hypothetical protein
VTGRLLRIKGPHWEKVFSETADQHQTQLARLTSHLQYRHAGKKQKGKKKEEYCQVLMYVKSD